tara:strand:+ start:62 stop:421 length:360 start_codon:yes stop_codon:yes gene_type:complete
MATEVKKSSGDTYEPPNKVLEELGQHKRTLTEEALEELNPEALFMDGLDSAILGIGGQFGAQLVVYSESAIIESLMFEQGMSHLEANEYFAYNIEGAYVGENTPIIIRDMNELHRAYGV